MKRRQAVTCQRSASHIQSHGRAHTCIKTHRRTCKSTQALHTHTSAVSLIDRLQERNIYTHTHSLSKHFPEACGRETFTGIRFQPGPQPMLRQKCAYSISIYTHKHTHNLTLPSCLTNHTLFSFPFLWVVFEEMYV